jgi:hypothetical protein
MFSLDSLPVGHDTGLAPVDVAARFRDDLSSSNAALSLVLF